MENGGRLFSSYFIHIGFFHLAAKLFLALAYVGFILESLKKNWFLSLYFILCPVCQL
jgi:membrane associated rhomboid family serine protease